MSNKPNITHARILPNGDAIIGSKVYKIVKPGVLAGIVKLQNKVHALEQAAIGYQERIAGLEHKVETLGVEKQQAREALAAVNKGQPLGPIVGAHTIINQSVEICDLKTQLDDCKHDKHIAQDKWVELSNELVMQREALAKLMCDSGYTTGYGDTFDDLMVELAPQLVAGQKRIEELESFINTYDTWLGGELGRDTLTRARIALNRSNQTNDI